MGNEEQAANSLSPLRFDAVELAKSIERQQTPYIEIASLLPGDQVVMSFSNETDADRVSQLTGTFKLESFDVDFGLNPYSDTPSARLKFLGGNALPSQYEGTKLELVGSALGASMRSMSIVYAGFPFEVRVENDSEAFLTQPVIDFSIKRADENGELRELPLNALNRVFESAEFKKFNQLIKDVEAVGQQLGFQWEDSFAKQQGLREDDDQELNGEYSNGIDYLKAHLGEYFIYSGQSKVMYVLRRIKGRNHIQIAAYNDLNAAEVNELRANGGFRMAVFGLNGLEKEKVTYNASNTSRVFDGGVAYEPNGEDSGTALSLRSAGRVIPYAPTINISNTGAVGIHAYPHLYTIGKDVKSFIEDQVKVNRTTEQLGLTLGDKHIVLPAKFNPGDLQETLARLTVPEA